jgi:hypothetical protein
MRRDVTRRRLASHSSTRMRERSSERDDGAEPRGRGATARAIATWAKRGVASALGVVLALYVVGLAVPEARGDEEAAIEEARATGRAKETPTSSRIEYVPQAPRAGR